MLKIIIFFGSLIFILKTTGLLDILGIGNTIASIGVFLGLTSSTWFPPIKSGLVMLLSKQISEEDLIEVPELNIYGVINNIGLFSTIIRNEIDNHKIIVPNDKLESSVINNISKLSRVGGLRELLQFKIGYLNSNNEKITTNEIRSFFESAFLKAKESKLDIKINFEKDLEIYLENPGDHSLDWNIFYFTDNVETRIKDRAKMYEEFYKESIVSNIGLDTPITANIASN